MARPRQVSDETILEIARSCFIEQGPSVSTTVIADRLGISQAALFKRFGTKQELMFAALLPPEKPAWIQAVEQGPDDRDALLQLQEIAQLISDFFDTLIPRIATLKASGCDMRLLLHSRYEVPPPLRGVAALTSWLAALQAQGRIGPVDPPTTALMLFGALQGRAFLSHIMGAPDTGELARYPTQLVENLWRGIAPMEGL